jgi:hypothetical protein
MKSLRYMAVVLSALAAAWLAMAPPVDAAESGVKAGFLICDVDSGFGYILGSSRDVKCTYKPSSGKKTEQYKGAMSKFGVDIGYLNSATIVWAVFAPTSDIKPGTLAGQYTGATGSATVGMGLGANVMVGGSNKAFTIQPLSLEGDMGLNVAGGIGMLTLESVRPAKTAKAKKTRAT